MRSITRDSVDHGCTYTLIWPRRRREIDEGNEVGGDGTKGAGGRRVGSSCLPRWEVTGGKSTADRIKLSATARDIPSEPPRKSLESFADEGRFFGTFASYTLTHARAYTHTHTQIREHETTLIKYYVRLHVRQPYLDFDARY